MIQKLSDSIVEHCFSWFYAENKTYLLKNRLHCQISKMEESSFKWTCFQRKNKVDQNSASAQEMFRVFFLSVTFTLSSRDILDSA